MLRVAAWRIVAGMADMPSFWHGPAVGQLPCHKMRPSTQTLPRTPCQNSVSAIVFGSGPFPASALHSFDSGPESLGGSFGSPEVSVDELVLFLSYGLTTTTEAQSHKSPLLTDLSYYTTRRLSSLWAVLYPEEMTVESSGLVFDGCAGPAMAHGHDGARTKGRQVVRSGI